MLRCNLATKQREVNLQAVARTASVHTALGQLQSYKAPLDLAYPTWSDVVAAAPTGCKHAENPKSARNSLIAEACSSVRWPGQGRAGQGRAGQGRAGQGRAGQGRAGQGRAGQGRAGQGRAGQGRAGQGRAGQGRAGQGRAGQGRAGQGRAGQGNTQRNAQLHISMSLGKHYARSASHIHDMRFKAAGQQPICSQMDIWDCMLTCANIRWLPDEPITKVYPLMC